MTKSGQPPKSFTTDTRVVRKNVAPASRRHLSLDNSFWVNTTFAGWKPAIHFFSRPRSSRRCAENTFWVQPGKDFCSWERRYPVHHEDAKTRRNPLRFFASSRVFVVRLFGCGGAAP